MSSSSRFSNLPSHISEEWLWGWDPTPGIVSVWADGAGLATIWRRIPGEGRLVREKARFRPWLLLDRLDDLGHLGNRLKPEASEEGAVWYRELQGDGSLRFLVSAPDMRTLKSAVLYGARERLGTRVTTLRELGQESILALRPRSSIWSRPAGPISATSPSTISAGSSSTWKPRDSTPPSTGSSWWPSAILQGP